MLIEGCNKTIYTSRGVHLSKALENTRNMTSGNCKVTVGSGSSVLITRITLNSSTNLQNITLKSLRPCNKVNKNKLHVAFSILRIFQDFMAG